MKQLTNDSLSMVSTALNKQAGLSVRCPGQYSSGQARGQRQTVADTLYFYSGCGFSLMMSNNWLAGEKIDWGFNVLCDVRVAGEEHDQQWFQFPSAEWGR